MRRLRSRLFSQRRTSHNVLAPLVIPEDEHGKEDMLSEAQARWNNTFQESLRDFQLKFEEEETARSVGEHGRVNEFDRTMTNFNDIFLKNHRRRQKLYEKADVLQEKRFKQADAARDAIFVQGQQDRAQACKIEEEMCGKQVEWHSATRKGLFSDGRQKLAQRCDALNTALVEQFDRLMEKQKEMDEVAERQSDRQDTPLPVPPDRTSGPVNAQPITSLHFSARVFPSSIRAGNLNATSQPMSIKSNDQLDMKFSQSPSSSMKSLSSAFSLHNFESLNLYTHPTSAESDQQKQSLHLVEQGNPEGNTQTDGGEDKFQSFLRCQEQRQETFLQDENGRDCQFWASEAARDTGELKRSTIFDQKMNQWSRKSQVEQILGREEERFRREIWRSIAFQNAEYQHWTAFKILMVAIIRQADAEEDLEEIYFKRQEDMLLLIYKCLAIQLHQRTEDQPEEDQFDYHSPMLEAVSRASSSLSGLQAYRLPHSPEGSSEGFTVRAIFKGPFIQKALPVPKAADNDQRNMHIHQGRFIDLKRVKEVFDCSQELRAGAFQRGAKERNDTFTINEARREAEFLKVQQKRKELFDEAEDSRETEFDKAQRQRESEFQTNEQKREDDFHKNEVKRNDIAREEQEDRAQLFQSIMSKLQQRCIDNEEERLKELELLEEELITFRKRGLSSLSLGKFPRESFGKPGQLKEVELLEEELITSGETGPLLLSLAKFPRRYLGRSLSWEVQLMITIRAARHQEHAA
ncbi:hypothetical protein C0992_009170 [Termitomyces sp. T32_za158]|nr:hypothetical protein C0992_009170 [Termitomyces sp. T32_za158]